VQHVHWSFNDGKGLDMRSIIFGIVLSATASSVAEAQLSGGQWRLSPEPNGRRVAVEVKPQPTVAVAPGMMFPVQPVAFNLIPAILMSDGTVWANFGFGFEPIVRPCGALVVAGQPSVIAGNGAQLFPSRPTYNQPVPNQQTNSQQMVAKHNNGSTVIVSNAAQLACFGRDASGRVFAYRF
jgi:hypothetical protein